MAKHVTQKIVVVQSGWVFCGEVSQHPNHSDMICINNAYNIRVWGTKNGLGELALRGRQKDTQLDAYGVVTVPKHAVLAYIDCEKQIEP